MSKAYDLYLADWKIKNPDVVQPEYPRSRPDMTGAEPILGNSVWDNRSKCFQLADGKVLEIGQTTNWMDIYAVFPDRKSWASFTQPMTFNEYWNG